MTGYNLDLAREEIRADRVRTGGQLTDIRAVAIGLLSEVERLNARVAELESGDTEWGIRYDGDPEDCVDRSTSREQAEGAAASGLLVDGARVVGRRVGPWVAVDEAEVSA